MDKYSLRYLPIFYEDFSEIIDYISVKLNNPSAALNLIDSVETAITERLPFAESYGIYESSRERKYPYYKINVKNFIIFYVVIDDEESNKIMEIRRILYNKQNWENII